MNADVSMDVSYRPDLPDWGAFVRWPTDGTDWIHPADVDSFLLLAPSRRVWKRTDWDGTFYYLEYGSIHVRVQPVMWLPVQDLDIHVGQQVELLSRFGKNDPGIFRIAEVTLGVQDTELLIQLQSGERLLPDFYHRDDLRPLEIAVELREADFEYTIDPPEAVEEYSLEP